MAHCFGARLAASYTIVVIALCGCDPPRDCSAFYGLPSEERRGVGDSVDVDIYVDATPSMRGYIGGAAYGELMRDALAGAVPSGRGQTRAFALRSATTGGVRPVDNLREAAAPGFYASGDTDVGLAVDSADTGQLTVVVTDLFQTDLGVSEVASLLAAKYFGDGKAVGLASLMLEFDGTVYDVDGASYPYSGRRPLYILMMGPRAAVLAYHRQLEGRLAHFDQTDAEFLLLGKDVGEGVSDVTVSSQEGVVEVDSIAPHALYVDLQQRSGQLRAGVELALREDGPGVGPLSAEVDPPVTCGGQGPSLTARVEGSGTSRTLSLAIVASDSMAQASRFRVRLVPAGMRPPDWVVARDLRASAMGGFDGSKTLRLEPFVRELLEGAEGAGVGGPPSAGDVFVFVE